MIRLAAAILIALSSTALAQSHRPYAGMEQRTVKALSPQQVDDLKAGRGMGLALPAELNGYPGPMHVLEHADALQLTAEQRGRTRSLFEMMRGEAMPLGERLIEQESGLDRLFADRTVTPERLRITTAEIGATQARLRETHLKYHLAMMDVLTPAQVEHYRALRGYGQPHHAPQHHRHH